MKIIEASPEQERISRYKKRLRETKKRQIEAIDRNAQNSKDRIRDQYKRKIDMLNR